MNPQNKKAINTKRLSSIKKPVKTENLRQNESKKESKSSESYEQTTITESNIIKKQKKQFHDSEKSIREYEYKDDERENRFLGKKKKNIRKSKEDIRKEKKTRT